VGSNPTSTAVDLREHRFWQPIGGRVVLPWSHLVVSVPSRMRSHCRAQPQLSFLVTAIADDPEQKRARRPGVHPCYSGLAGTVRDRPHTRQLTHRITLSDREVLENTRRAACMAGSWSPIFDWSAQMRSICRARGTLRYPCPRASMALITRRPGAAADDGLDGHTGPGTRDTRGRACGDRPSSRLGRDCHCIGRP
jgi:hypothetical protein